MSDPDTTGEAAAREAAEWHARLGVRPVSAATLEAFRLWRRSPANAEAYRGVEAVWRTSGRLSADAEVQALTQATLERTRGRSNPRWTPRAAVLVAVSVLAAAGFVFMQLSPRGVYETEIGGRRVVALEDGTRVQLDTDTRLKVRFNGTERRVMLEQGQALFTVAHDAGRPFTVAAGGTEVTALGTVFDVRRERAGARVTLVQGSVAVSDAGPREPRRWRLAPGQQLRTAAVDPKPVAIDPAVETSWAQGRLVFRNAPLRDAVAEVNRYLPEEIVLAPGPVADVQVNGVFATGDRDAFVAAVSDLFGLSVERQADGRVRLGASSAGG
ncbi:hypothetical protein BZG35_16950 [Brevundimonas sp. LM2]|uniref:FecR family protein n=1 Tax=Brevundimonas sp. LM2 TaxID=1938605 RepID=UPI000983B73D|nr:FecR domain-containing protein [Brevundimonas sp. LM2]AQR63612.1 hypothetical protein BZG35_16950 [Brevundimonas sp. LM2]